MPASLATPAEPEAIPGWKRALDVMLILLSSPLWLSLMILIMVGIKLSSQGPVFFQQERVGRRGARFLLFKFRSMRVNAETVSHESHVAKLISTGVPMTKLDAIGDPRIFPWGRILRATGLDELPQLFNILRGEMSLVGPRPCTPREFVSYQEWQRERVSIAPGLTGYWQVHGKNKTTFNEMIDMDLFYGKNMSLALDLSIILKTIPALIDQAAAPSGKAGTRVPRGSYDSPFPVGSTPSRS